MNIYVGNLSYEVTEEKEDKEVTAILVGGVQELIHCPIEHFFQYQKGEI